MNTNLKCDSTEVFEMRIDEFTSAKLMMMLPATSEIDELIRLCREEAGVKNVPQARALRAYMDEIIKLPTDHNAWRDLSHVFGLMPMLQWKFLYVSHCLQPKDSDTLAHLGITCCRLGNKRMAISIIERAISCAQSQLERDDACEVLAWVKSPECIEGFAASTGHLSMC